MSGPLVFVRPARAEFDEAAEWYDQRKSGLGAAFTAAVQQSLDHICDRPLMCPVVLDDIREARVEGFPYSMYFRINARHILVLAIFHDARDPSIWQDRA